MANERFRKIREDRFHSGNQHRITEDFFSLLSEHRIQRLVDVRRFLASARFPHFSGTSLESLAQGKRLDYFYLGDLLGGYRRGVYQSYMTSAECRAGLERLEKMASQARTAFFCAERFPWRCHRLFIAAALGVRGWRVVHIINRDQTWIPGRGREGYGDSARGQIELELSG